jgi:hypothetical protein
LAYLFRIFVPLFIIVYYKWFLAGIAYLGVFSLFWVLHLGFTGCPNCINKDCPLNPG